MDSQRQWKNWADHPAVVVTLVIAALVTIGGGHYRSIYKSVTEKPPTPTYADTPSKIEGQQQLLPLTVVQTPTPTPRPISNADGSTQSVIITDSNSREEVFFTYNGDRKLWAKISVSCSEHCSGVYLGIGDVYQGLDNVVPSASELKEGKRYFLTTPHFRLFAKVTKIETGGDTNPEYQYPEVIKKLQLELQVKFRLPNLDIANLIRPPTETSG